MVIPKNVANIVWNPFIAAGTLTGIGCSDENTTFTSVDGVLYTKSKDVLYICPAGKSGEFTVPEGVKRIHAFAFFGADKITKLELCDGLESIDINAFAGCSFTSVRVPNSVTFIGWNSLGYNSSGEKIDGFTIIGGADSAAEQYASENGFAFTEYVEGAEYEDVELTEGNFPDPVFREYLSGFDTDPADGILSGNELVNITYIDLPSSGVTSLKGIELLPAVTSINCSNNPISSIDVSKNSKLKFLYINQCALASLDVSENTSLIYTNAGNNVFDYNITGGAVALDDLPPDFDVNRAIFIGNAYYDSESRTICTDSDYISYYYDIGNNNTVQFTITDKSAPVTVTKNDGISIYNMSEPITLYKGQNIYIYIYQRSAQRLRRAQTTRERKQNRVDDQRRRYPLGNKHSGRVRYPDAGFGRSRVD